MQVTWEEKGRGGGAFDERVCMCRRCLAVGGLLEMGICDVVFALPAEVCTSNGWGEDYTQCYWKEGKVGKEKRKKKESGEEKRGGDGENTGARKDNCILYTKKLYVLLHVRGDVLVGDVQCILGRTECPEVANAWKDTSGWL